jgi:Ser/Thr protein kinase RdoA (MazF antagonist)
VLIGRSDNITFRVHTPSQDYLLRLHPVTTEAFAAGRKHPDFITSELAWLTALADQAGLPVQRPQRTRQGALVAFVPAPQTTPLKSPVKGRFSRSVPATLLTWLPGKNLESSAVPDSSLQDLWHRAGGLLASLHQFALAWSPPPDFQRPEYGASYLLDVLQALQSGVAQGVVSSPDAFVFEEVASAVLYRLKEYPRRRTRWGLIHADTHTGNWIVHAGQMRLIDFSLCGWGYYLFDLGCCLPPLQPQQRQALLAGYQALRPLSQSDLLLIDMFALLARLGAYAFHIHDPAQHEWIHRRIPQVVQDECRPFLEGATIYL